MGDGTNNLMWEQGCDNQDGNGVRVVLYRGEDGEEVAASALRHGELQAPCSVLSQRSPVIDMTQDVLFGRNVAGVN
jgi:hypothetical protein